MEYTNRNIIANNINCGSISSNANFINQTLQEMFGQFTVTGSTTAIATSNLSAAITSSATTIPLVNASGFTASGGISIDNELINYTSKSGNSLLNATRGVGGSSATSHSSAAPVIQNQCILTIASAVPSFASPQGKRTLQEVLSGAAFSLGLGGGTVTAAVIGAQTVNVSGNPTIINPTVTTSSDNFPGANIVAGTNVVFNGSATTQISNDSGGLVTSSSTLRTTITAINSIKENPAFFNGFIIDFLNQ